MAGAAVVNGVVAPAISNAVEIEVVPIVVVVPVVELEVLLAF